jgi:hypothetical protein
MMPPSTQPVTVVSCSFKQQQPSNKWQVVSSGQVNGQLSHQLKHGCNLQQQFSQWGNFSWQQPSQSQHVSPQPLLHELHEALQPASLHVVQPPLEHDGAPLPLASFGAVEAAGADVASAVGAGGCAAV